MSVCECFTDQQLKNFTKVFRQFSKSGGGVITPEDFPKALKKIGIRATADEIQEMLNEIGEENPIDVIEFIISAYYFLRAADSQDELIRAFQIFDTKNTGKIPANTIYQILSNLKHPIEKPVIDEIIGQLDQDGSHMIDYAQMIRMMRPNN